VARPGDKAALARALLLWLGRVVEHPVVLLLLFRFAEALWRRWLARQRLVKCQRQVLPAASSELDTELLQGCLLTAEDLLTLGRMEKRVLFTRPLREVLCGNDYLVRKLVEAGNQCQQQGRNCMVLRLLGPDERFHILQHCVDACAELFGTNYMHHNALGGGHNDLFKQIWYCVTVMAPSRPSTSRKRSESLGSVGSGRAAHGRNTCTFIDMSRSPRPMLRIVMVNESELRRVADGKLIPPRWGCFNSRHQERYRMLEDFARNFHKQLLRSPSDGVLSPKGRDSRSNPRMVPKPDGGTLRRVNTQEYGLAPIDGGDNSDSGDALALPVEVARYESADLSRLSGHLPNQDAPAFKFRPKSRYHSGPATHTAASDGGPKSRSASKEAALGDDVDNCFLRLHVPHFIGRYAPKEPPAAGGGLAIGPPRLAFDTRPIETMPVSLKAFMSRGAENAAEDTQGFQLPMGVRRRQMAK